MLKKHRAHPVTIFFNLGRVFYLIVIPVARGFVSALRGGISQWAAGAWMDILVFTFMLGAAVIAWLMVSLEYDEHSLFISSGVINRRFTSIPWDRVTTVSMIEAFYLRPVRALRFRADTLGGSFKDSDFTVLLSRKQASAIMDARKAVPETSSGQVYRPSTSSIVALSLLSSNSFGGILFISAFISQSGKLLGREFSESIIGTFEHVSRSLAFGIDPAAAAIGYMLLAGWFIGFLLSFFRYKNFTLTRRENILSVLGGIFTKREYYIKYKDLNFIDVRQSVVTKLLRLSSLYISVVGYGKQKDDISCVIPTESNNRFYESLTAIFPAFPPSERQIKPQKPGIARFIGQPVATFFLIGFATLLFLWLFPSWSGFIWFVGLMATVPALLFLWVRILDFLTCGVSFDGENYTLRYSHALSLHTVVIPKGKIAAIELNQGFFQKFGPYCDLIISARAEGRSIHRCRSLIKQELLELFNL